MTRTAIKYKPAAVSISAVSDIPLFPGSLHPYRVDESVVMTSYVLGTVAAAGWGWQGHQRVDIEETPWAGGDFPYGAIVGGRYWQMAIRQFSVDYRCTTKFSMPTGGTIETAEFQSARSFSVTGPSAMLPFAFAGFTQNGFEGMFALTSGSREDRGTWVFEVNAAFMLEPYNYGSTSYGFTLDFNGQIPEDSRTDRTLRMNGLSQLELVTPAYRTVVGGDADLWIYTITPTLSPLPPATYTRERIVLSDAEDDALFNGAFNAPPWYNTGDSGWRGFVISRNPWGYLVSIDKNVGGQRRRKFFQFDDEWLRYREITFNPLDAITSRLLEPGRATTGLALMDNFGNIAYRSQGGTPGDSAFLYYGAGPEVMIPDWPKITGDSVIRTWALPLDGHDFYVLKLGLEGTLVYDVTTQKWSEWSSEGNSVWAVNAGFQWVGGTGKSATNIVVGDDTTGNLYWLDMDNAYDEGQTPEDENQYFERVATTYFPVRGRAALPCYNIYLSCDMEAIEGQTVELRYSDDGGRNYISAGVIGTPEGQSANEYAWRSLGRMTAPGRVFQIVDNGIAARLDSLEINEGVGDG